MTTPADFVAMLQDLPDMVGVFNPWKDYDSVHDVGEQAPGIRRDNLCSYLTARAGRARLILVGEAPGYQGAHFSGIAMTSERILLGKKVGIPAEAVFVGAKRRSSKSELYPDGPNEPTATIAWSLLLGLGMKPEDFIFWNSFPCHPHKASGLLTNRAPTPRELDQTKHLLPALLSLSNRARLVAVGRIAQKVLASLGHDAVCVRHPAMGGATEFRAGIRALQAEHTAVAGAAPLTA